MARALMVWGLVVAAVSGVAYLLLSPTGLALVWDQARPYLPPAVQTAEVSGRLVGPIRIRGLRVAGEGFALTLARAELDWRPLELLAGDLVLDYVRAEGLRVERRPNVAAEPAAAGDAPPLPTAWAPPVNVHVRALDLRRASLLSAPGAAPVTLDRLRARAGFGADGLYVRELKASAPRFSLTGEGDLTPAGDYPLRATLDWTLTLPERPPLAGHTRLTGALRRSLTLTQNVAPPLGLRAEARVERPLAESRWRLTAGAEAVDLGVLGPDLPPITGGFRLQAQGAGATGRGRLTLQGRHPAIGPFRGEADWAADLADQALRLRQAAVGAGDIPGRLTARGEIRSEDGVLRLDLAGDWTDLRWPVSGDPRWRSQRGHWRLTGTPADLAASVGGRVNQDGRVDAAATYRDGRLAGTVRWRRLAWPDPALPLRSPEGELVLTGTPTDYRFRLAAGLAHGAGRAGRVRATGSGDLDRLILADLRAEVMDGVLAGDGRVAWRPVPRAELRLRGDGLDPGTWFQRWPGQLGGRVAAAGALTPTGPELGVRELAVTGRLRDRAVRLTGSGDYRPGQLRLTDLAVRAGDTRATLSGEVSDNLALTWALTSPDLATLHPDAAGHLTGRGRLTGTPRQPRVSAEVTGSGLAFADYRLGELALTADVDWSGTGESRLRLALDEAALADRTVSRLRLTGSGRPAEHALRLEATTDLGTLSTDVTGSWRPDRGRWAFRLRRAALAPARVPETWRLSAPAAGWAGAEGLSLNQTCFTAGAPRLCVRGDLSPDTASGRFRAEALPLGYLLPLLPPGIGVEGEVDGRGRLAWQAGGPVTGDAELTTSGGRLMDTDEGDQPVTVAAFRPSTLRLTATRETIRGEAGLELAGTDRLAARVRMGRAARSLREAPLSGRIRGTLTDLGAVPLFVPEVAAISGRVEADVSLAGRVGEPQVDGQVRLLAERLALATPGITVRDLSLAAEPAGDGSLRLTGRARSGDGELRLAGTARLGAAERRLQARIRGKEFLAFDSMRARVWVSPDLSVALAGREVTLSGEVRVPRADIALRELPAKGVVAVSTDQEIVRPQAEDAPARSPWRVTSRVRLILGDQVRFEGFGLTSGIAGDLTVVDEPDRPTTASGELRTEAGEYRAYGQRLTIETGKLLFGGGPITDPGLDVRAVRRPRGEVLVGVRAYGPLRQPRFDLFSEPAMPQAEQLSWLVLGRPLDETSGGEHAALSRAAVVLGMKGGARLAETVGNDLGLDEITVETQAGATGDQAALVLGKYLSPRLYVSYGIGLFEAVNTLRMQYTLTEHWRLVTESSAIQTGGDLFYTIETGQ